MIKRIFRPMSLLVFVILATLGLFFLGKYMPLKILNATTDLSLLKSLNNKPDASLKLTEKNLNEISQMAESILENEKLPLTSLLNFLVNQPSSAALFPGKIELKLFNEDQEVSLVLSHIPTFYKPEIITLINEKVKSDIIERYSHKLNQQKSIIENSIAQKNQIITDNKIEEKTEIVEVEKPVSKPTIKMNNMPPEIADNIVKFKEFKTQKELKLKEIVAQLSALPQPNQSPLVMLTSNLQKKL